MKIFFKLTAFALIFALSTGVSFAFIVSAPAVEAQLAILNAKTEANQMENRAKWIESIQKAVNIYNTGVKQVQEIQRGITQVKDQYEFWKKHAGDWQAIASRVRTGATQIALEQSTFSTTPNMGAGDLFTEQSSVQGLAAAVDEANKLIAGRETKMTPEDLRATLTRIVGEIPESESAGVSSFAQTSIEDDMAYLGRTNKAIEELQKEKERIRSERDAKVRTGLFTEADKAQYEMADEDIGKQVESLQLQTLMRVQKQLIVANSFRVKSQNDVERKRIEERNLRQATQSFLGN